MFVLFLQKKSWVAMKRGAGANLGACASPRPGLKTATDSTYGVRIRVPLKV